MYNTIGVRQRVARVCLRQTRLVRHTVVVAGDIVASNSGIEWQERIVGRVQNVGFHAIFPDERPAPGSLETDDTEHGHDDDEARQDDEQDYRSSGAGVHHPSAVIDTTHPSSVQRQETNRHLATIITSSISINR